MRRALSTVTAAAARIMSSEVDAFIQKTNEAYEKVHLAFENNFWATKMNLSGCSDEQLASTKKALDAFLNSPQLLTDTRAMLATPGLTPAQTKTLKTFEKTCLCYMMTDPSANALRDTLTDMEAALETKRNGMNLGYTLDGQFTKASSVQLRNNMKTNKDERVRKACYEGLRSIGPFVAKDLIEIVKRRNKMAKLLGYEDFYDFKVQQAEGFSKRRLFEIMDGLEQKTREINVAALKRVAEQHGESALQPYNLGFVTSGDAVVEQDPYFPFENAVDAWARSFAAMDISYRSALIQLDLCDRDKKYSNGFCHWPQPAWRKHDGTWVPSQTNLTSLATPNATGSGYTALTTLMHECGHAAHFANIDQPSPLFSQERAPTSVAYAENQSMFLDSLCDDAAWLGRYAYNREGQPIPWEVVKKGIEAKRPYDVFGLRSMLAVPYFEKALYEATESDLEGGEAFIVQLADRIEESIQGGPSSRPLLCVPHILADESACYYHGYVLAEMSVWQTRDHFLRKYGVIVDNPQVGRDLAAVYWLPGNSECFLDLVEKLTGRPLAGDAWVSQLQQDLPAILQAEHRDYLEAVKAGPKLPPGSEVNLDARLRLVHGDEVLADSQQHGIAAAARDFKAWVRAKYF